MLLLCLLASETAGCLLFTDPVNTAPIVSISTQDDPNNLVRSKTTYFTADAFDPDQSADSLRFDWYQGKTCDSAFAGPPASLPTLGHSPFPFRPTELGTGCIAVVVTDSRGATATATLNYTVVDQAPIAVITIPQATGQPASVAGQSYPLALYSQITLSGADSHDPEEDLKLLTLIWSVYADSTQILLPGCPDISKGPYVCTFATTNPGSYRVKLVVSDSSGLQDTAEQAIEVADDQLPDIIIDSAEPLPPTSPNESPLLLLANLDNAFTINRVEDDGDPYPSSDPLNPEPASPAGFVWFFRLDQAGQLFQRWIGGGPTFTIPANMFKPQQTVQVRAEYHDRVTACQPKTPGCNAVFAACDPNATICYSSNFRAQWVTWTVTFR
jgi:hypothetical protein